ncbi:glycosyltransferase [Chloroflexota bacterium]
MNILFIHEIDWIEKPVLDIHFIAEGLSLRGHRVYAIDYADTWGKDKLSGRGSLRTKEYDGISRAFAGSSVTVRRPGFIRIPILSRISASITHYLEIRRTIKEKDIDAIVLYSVPTNGLQAVYLARKFNIPIVFRSIDILNMLVPNAILSSVTMLLEKKIYSSVDAVLPNTPQYQKYVESMGADKTKLKYLAFPVDTGLFHPLDSDPELRKKWELKDNDRVIVFIGTLFNFSGLDDFIRAFPALLKEVPVAKLLIVGDGVQRNRLEEIIAKENLEASVTITGFQPYQTMPQYINLADVCINTFTINKDTIDVFPAKIMQYVACGKPTVATELRGIKTILPGETHGVIYVKNAEAMVKEVISLLKSEKRRKDIGNAGYNRIKDRFSYKIISEELETILKNMIKEKRGDSR